MEILKSRQKELTEENRQTSSIKKSMFDASSSFQSNLHERPSNSDNIIKGNLTALLFHL